ncbi:Tn3 family transposase [Micromonospora sp. NPDC047670]|uniref:WD40 repeat domain-containing protein n=1 Tax=Micromonospora sp. NPDC047670 TaxID=3364252 RepID=UPI00371A7B7D
MLKNESEVTVDIVYGDTCSEKDVINWRLIENHWPDSMRVVLSIREGRLSSAALLRCLGNESKLIRIYGVTGLSVLTPRVLCMADDHMMRRFFSPARRHLETDKDPDAVLETLDAADWSAFTPARDLPPLRDALTALERVHGVTEAHRYATAKIKAYGALLRHADTHRAKVLTYVLSPCGRYLALGSRVGEEFDDGGVLQIWEVATGRCVNVIDGIPGGVGWESDRHMVQWSADASRVAVVHHKFKVGVWESFGDQEDLGGEPIAEMAVSDSRPCFAFAPDGERVVMWGGWYLKDKRGRLVSLDDVDDLEDIESLIPVESLSDEMLAVLDGGPLCLDWSTWSKDGERVYGYASSGWACSIDVAARRVVWLKQTHDFRGPLPAWSPDERHLAHQRGGQLVLSDAVTGKPVAVHAARPGAALLSWGPGGRLAVVVPAHKDEGAHPGVSIVKATGEHDYDLDLALRPTGYDTPDLTAWAWAPDGSRAACLTDEGRIEVWNLGERPERLRVVEVPEDADGVLWGADDVLVIITSLNEDGGTFPGLRFVWADTGEVVGAFQFLQEPPGSNPLVDEEDGEDLGLDLQPHPAFALDARTWGVAFEPGLVIAPPGRERDLDALLAWSVGRRFAWPVRWGALEIFPNASAAADGATPPLDELVESFRGSSPRPAEPPAWPPPNTATFADLLLLAGAVVEWVRARDPQGVHEPGLSREIAILHARRNEADQARRFVELSPGHLRTQVASQIERILREAEQRDKVPAEPEPPTPQEIAALAKAHERFLRTPRGQRSNANAELVRQAAHSRHISAVLDLLEQAPLETYLGLGSHDKHYLTLCALRTVATGSDKEIRR